MMVMFNGKVQNKNLIWSYKLRGENVSFARILSLWWLSKCKVYSLITKMRHFKPKHLPLSKTEIKGTVHHYTLVSLFANFYEAWPTITTTLNGDPEEDCTEVIKKSLSFGVAMCHRNRCWTESSVLIVSVDNTLWFRVDIASSPIDWQNDTMNNSRQGRLQNPPCQTLRGRRNVSCRGQTDCWTELSSIHNVTHREKLR